MWPNVDESNIKLCQAVEPELSGVFAGPEQ